jgi:hypothetical protein
VNPQKSIVLVIRFSRDRRKPAIFPVLHLIPHRSPIPQSRTKEEYEEDDDDDEKSVRRPSGSGRAKLRLSRGFPGGLAFGVTPQKSIVLVVRFSRDPRKLSSFPSFIIATPPIPNRGRRTTTRRSTRRMTTTRTRCGDDVAEQG